ncbi:hypothetical protein F8388_024691 [Cannabis sativa]|uniref:Uncharacterized protein n=1 Tax=Cannabis sativa TaxID=3483 RepID=A0A7J6GC57_CANSA|nr:hypothetical protein F8388_024691 [Cannabis sativa]
MSKSFSQTLFFCRKTLVTHLVLEVMRVRLGFVGKLVVEKIGRSGGLCLFWSSNVTVVLKGYSRNHIDVMVCSHGDLWWLYTGFYGQPEAHLRSQFWCLLERLADGYSGPWFGVGYEGARFTWCNKHTNGSFLQERLDRMLAFNVSKFLCLTLEALGSDHRPLLTCILRACGSRRCPKQKGRFHFEMAWANDPGCREIIAITGGHLSRLILVVYNKRLRVFRGLLMIEWYGFQEDKRGYPQEEGVRVPNSLLHINPISLPARHVAFVWKYQKFIRLPGRHKRIHKPSSVPKMNIFVYHTVNNQQATFQFILCSHVDCVYPRIRNKLYTRSTIDADHSFEESRVSREYRQSSSYDDQGQQHASPCYELVSLGPATIKMSKTCSFTCPDKSTIKCACSVQRCETVISIQVTGPPTEETTPRRTLTFEAPANGYA